MCVFELRNHWLKKDSPIADSLSYATESGSNSEDLKGLMHSISLQISY